MELNIAFFASHGGSNMQAIIDEINAGTLKAKASCVISNNSASMALERARKEGIPAYHISSLKFPDENALAGEMIKVLKENNVNIICLAGYMKKLPDKIIEHVKGRVLNIHPALLPKFGGTGMYGMLVHQSVIESKEIESGCTVHLVNSVYDEGKILHSKKVPVLPDDTPETLAARVLEQEHILYAETLRLISEDKIII